MTQFQKSSTHIYLLPEFLVGENSLQYFDESQEVSSLNIRRSASTIDGPNQITFWFMMKLLHFLQPKVSSYFVPSLRLLIDRDSDSELSGGTMLDERHHLALSWR